MAAVACVRMVSGPFLTAAIPAGKGEFERWRVVDFEVCLKARARCLVGGDRSMLAVARESGERKRGEKRGRSSPIARGRAQKDQEHCTSVVVNVVTTVVVCGYGVVSH